ncbi:MAG: cytidine deaminase [Patiriisocius sp.]|uniref:cytidine deaminase n=1 Tax=Patiriisocius sp. TaxID=2822396 RepID=UPI003EF25653
MKKHIIETVLEVYDSVSELPQNIQNLMNKAQKARDNAYAPYSSFMVGAALQLANGKIVQGNNQENAAYPSGLCAERVAVFYAGATYPGVAINTVAITVKSLNHKVETPTPPCGACRQSLAEYEVNQKSPMNVYFMGEKGKVVKANSIKDLLPLVFDSSFLK